LVLFWRPKVPKSFKIEILKLKLRVTLKETFYEKVRLDKLSFQQLSLCDNEALRTTSFEEVEFRKVI